MHVNATSSYFQKLVAQLLRPKRGGYSQEAVGSFLNEHSLSLQDVSVRNKYNEQLKCSLVEQQGSEVCIVYLHGFGSTRLQGLGLVPHLPPRVSLCVFDMSGSGKSEGDLVTYGCKQHEDIDYVLAQLHTIASFPHFVLWGRSMGAVAALLYLQRKSLLTTPHQELVKCAVIDSPFNTFKDVSRSIALKRLTIPSFLINIALDYVEDSFTRLITNKHHNPFNIDLSNLSPTIPAIFLYSEQDEVVPFCHSQTILSKYKGVYEKIVFKDCGHNQTRPSHLIANIFTLVEKHCKCSRRPSLDRKRGIRVCTPSKEKKSNFATIGLNSSIQYEERPYNSIYYEERNHRSNAHRNTLNNTHDNAHCHPSHSFLDATSKIMQYQSIDITKEQDSPPVLKYWNSPNPIIDPHRSFFQELNQLNEKSHIDFLHNHQSLNTSTIDNECIIESSNDVRNSLNSTYKTIKPHQIGLSAFRRNSSLRTTFFKQQGQQSAREQSAESRNQMARHQCLGDGSLVNEWSINESLKGGCTVQKRESIRLGPKPSLKQAMHSRSKGVLLRRKKIQLATNETIKTVLTTNTIHTIDALNTIDVETNILINKKLAHRESSKPLPRSKRQIPQREIRLTYERYLQ